jgi:Uma2 family endonuclease
MSLRSEAPQKTCTFEQFLAHADAVWAEWIDGEVFFMSPASDRHQDLVRFLSALLSLFIEAHDAGWIRSAPFSMYLPERPQSREPDLLFVRKERMDRIRSTYLEGPADLVVEIVSPDSVSRDRGEKFVEYEAAGIPEYWLIDPLREQCEPYHLDEQGRYHPMRLESGVLTSQAVPGFRLRIDWLWRKPLPKILDAVSELHLLS